VRFCLTDGAYGSAINETETRWPVLQLRTTTLDLLPRTIRPDFLKMDVEGEEGAVLDGAAQLLARRKMSICCEVHSREAARSVLGTIEARSPKPTNIQHPTSAGVSRRLAGVALDPAVGCE
jgi:hypothetical protein